MSFSIKLNVKTSLADIESRTLNAIARHLNIKLSNRTMEKELQFSMYNLMYQALTGSQETQSIFINYGTYNNN